MYAVFFPTSGKVRLFEAYNLAQAAYPRLKIVSGPADVPANESAFWYEALFEAADAAGNHFSHGETHVTCKSQVFPKVRTAEELPPQDLQKLWWDLALATGDLVTKHTRRGEDKRSRRRSSFVVDLARANEVLATPPHKIPAQARAIVEYLTEQEFDHYTRDEVQRFCLSVAFMRKVKTRQDPWRIFRYYLPLLTQLGVLR